MVTLAIMQDVMWWCRYSQISCCTLLKLANNRMLAKCFLGWIIKITFVYSRLNPVVSHSASSGHLVLVHKCAHCCQLYCVSVVNHLALWRRVCFRRGKPVSSSVIELLTLIACLSWLHLDSIPLVWKIHIIYILLTVAGALLVGCHQLSKHFFFLIDDTRLYELMFLLANSLLYLWLLWYNLHTPHDAFL